MLNIELSLAEWMEVEVSKTQQQRKKNSSYMNMAPRAKEGNAPTVTINKAQIAASSHSNAVLHN